MSEEKQGALFAREMLTNVANEIPISIWYDWRDDGSDPNEAEHHFGLVRNAYQTGQAQVYEGSPLIERQRPSATSSLAMSLSKDFPRVGTMITFSHSLRAANVDLRPGPLQVHRIA